MGLSHSPRIVTDGLVFCVDAASRRSYPGAGTTWTDLTANKNNGTLINSPSFNSANGGSIVFDGTDDKVLFSEINLQTTFTACIFVKFDPGSSYDAVVIGHSGGQYILFVYNSTLIYTKDGPYDSTSSASLSSDTWHSLTITRNGTSVNWFQDGVNIGNGTIGSSDMGFTALGSYSDNSNYVLNGNIASMQLYNRVLTDEEIKQNYLATKGRFQ